MNQALYLYRSYKEGLDPFKSTSDFSDNEIILFMEKHFPKHRWFHANPEERIKNRRKIESWLHCQFLLLGGRPKTKHPCYFTLNKSSFIKEFESLEGKSKEAKIPLHIFSSENISFTYPDSFFSEWLSRNTNHALYQKELNGRVFTLEEMISLLKDHKIPNDVYMDTPNYKYHFYIEAQVWDYELLESVRT